MEKQEITENQEQNQAQNQGKIQLYKRLGNLLSIKSLVTLVLTAVFAYLTCSGGVTADQFLTVFTVVIAFYFGTQAEKNASKNT